MCAPCAPVSLLTSLPFRPELQEAGLGSHLMGEESESFQGSGAGPEKPSSGFAGQGLWGSYTTLPFGPGLVKEKTQPAQRSGALWTPIHPSRPNFKIPHCVLFKQHFPALTPAAAGALNTFN